MCSSFGIPNHSHGVMVEVDDMVDVTHMLGDGEREREGGEWRLMVLTGGGVVVGGGNQR